MGIPVERPASQGEAFSVHGVVSPLVGRDRELATLTSLLERAIEYQAPQMITVIGNQGTGKARLVSEWLATIQPPVRVYRGRATARAQRYSAIARLLRDRFGLGEADDDASKTRFRDTVQMVFGDRRVGEV